MPYLKNKNIYFQLTLFIFLVFSSGLFFNLKPAKAAVTSFTTYYLITSNTSPTIKGTITTSDPANTHITVTINGHEYTDDSIDGTTWSVEVDDVLAVDTYIVSSAANLGGVITIAPLVGLIIEPVGFPFEFYFTDIMFEGEGTAEVASITFVDEYTFTLDGFSLHFPSETEVTAAGGVTFDLMDWAMESMDSGGGDLISVIQFGIPNLDLNFSNPIEISIDVGTSYNGLTLNIFTSESFGGDSASWESIGTCLVAGGSCNFSVSHASFFGISEHDLGGSDKAKISSWKAYQYEDQNKSCSSRLKLTIKGKHFDNDTTVKIGGREASSVDVQSSKKIVAKFCLTKLLEAKTDHKKTITVKNPDTDVEEADKKIDLDNILPKLSTDNFSMQTTEGIQNIQRALVKLGYLDSQYITGVYGPLTTEAVKKFQADNGLPQTGIVGPLTKEKLTEKVN